MASDKVLTSTPSGQNVTFVSDNRFQALAEWAGCDQTPIGRREGTNPKRPAPSLSVSASLQSFSEMSTDDKLTSIFQKLENLDKYDSVISNLVCKVQQTSNKVENAELCINKHTQYMKKLAYHSIDIEARSRRNNIVFYGLADSNGEDTYEKLKHFLIDFLEIDLDDVCVQRVHRLGSLVKSRRITQTPRRPIIAAFRDYRDTEYIMQNVYKLYESRFDRDYPKEIAAARKRLWDYQNSMYKNGEKVKLLYPAKLIVNGRCVAEEFPEWQEILRMDSLNYIDLFSSDHHVYSRDTDIDNSSVLPNSSPLPVTQVSQVDKSIVTSGVVNNQQSVTDFLSIQNTSAQPATQMVSSSITDDCGDKRTLTNRGINHNIVAHGNLPRAPPTTQQQTNGNARTESALGKRGET